MKTETYELKRDITLKTGETLSKGMEANLIDFSDRSATFYFKALAREVKLSILNLWKNFEGFESRPDDEELEYMLSDGTVSTCTGYNVEPDGRGPDNSPSWLIVLGLI